MNQPHTEIVTAIADAGCYVGASILSPDLTASLRAEVIRLHANGDLREAKLRGSVQQAVINANAVQIRWRGDEVAWLDPTQRTLIELMAADAVDALRKALNAALFIGALDTELHYARYASGTYYKTHLDAFRHNNTRVMSLVFYLNDAWNKGDGGELVIYDGFKQALHRVQPCSGTMVAFLSERFSHEVLPTQATRLSLTGWMRRGARN